MKQCLYLLIMCLFLVLVGCKPAAVTPPASVSTVSIVELVRAVATVDGKVIELSTQKVNILPRYGAGITLEFSDLIKAPDWSSYSQKYETAIDGPTLTTPTLQDVKGNLVPQYNFTFRVVPNAQWISWTISEELKQRSHSTMLMPGETIRIELPAEMQDTFTEQLAQDLAGVNYVLEWLTPTTVHFSVKDSDVRSVDIYADTRDMPTWALTIVAPQKLVILDPLGNVRASYDIPISATGAISMSKDYNAVRLARPRYLSFTNVPLAEYEWNLETIELSSHESIMHSPRQDYTTFDRSLALRKVAGTLLDQLNMVAGLSNDERRIAAYGSGEIIVIDLATQGRKSYPTATLEVDGHDTLPDNVFWSPNDSMVFYNASPSADERDILCLYSLDLQTGVETPLGRGHYLRSASPFSEHLFTSSYDAGQQSFHLVDYAGNQVQLNGTGERVILSKWIDPKRALINTSSENSYGVNSADSTCYIYHIDENRWEFVSDGYGFDYDVETGRVFVLQNR